MTTKGCIIILLFSISITCSEEILCDIDGDVCEDIDSQGNAKTVAVIRDWWDELSEQKPLKCQGEPVYKEDFQPRPELVILESKQCSEYEESGMKRESFSFKGKIQDFKFEGGGKFKFGALDEVGITDGVCISRSKVRNLDIVSVVGSFKDGRPHGVVKLELSDKSVIVTRVQDGIMNGLTRQWNASGALQEVSYWANGLQVGMMWYLDDTSGDLIYTRTSMFPQGTDRDKMMTSSSLVIRANTSGVIASDLVQFRGLFQQSRFVKDLTGQVQDCFFTPSWSTIEGIKFKYSSKSRRIKYPSNAKQCQKSAKQWIRGFNSSDLSFFWAMDPLMEDVKAEDGPFKLVQALEQVEDNRFVCQLWHSDAKVRVNVSQFGGTQELRGSIALDFNPEDTPYFPIINKRIKRIDGFMPDPVTALFQGSLIIQLEDSRHLLLQVKDSVPHGMVILLGISPIFPLAQEFGEATDVMVSEGIGLVGTFRHGRPEGVFWLSGLGAGYLYGHLDSKNTFSGNRIAYIYPDMETALLGHFEKRVMKRAKTTTIVDQKCNDFNIMELEFGPESGPELFFSPPTNISFGDGPRTQDPFEAKMVELRDSNVPGAGEGVFAKVDFEPGDLMCPYSGIVFRNKEEKDIYHERYTNNKSLTDYERRWAKKYSIGLPGGSGSIEIPIELDTPGSWHPTLGPKVNTDFKERHRNCVYGPYEHPRYGLIQGVFAIKAIKAGQELFTDYGYREDAFPSDFLWYHQARKQMLEELQRTTEAKAKVKAKKKAN